MYHQISNLIPAVCPDRPLRAPQSTVPGPLRRRGDGASLSPGVSIASIYWHYDIIMKYCCISIIKVSLLNCRIFRVLKSMVFV